MKKFLAIAVIAATFTACNDEKKTEETVVNKDTTTTMMAPDTTKMATPDTSKMKMETTTTDTMKKMEGKMEEKK